MARFKRPEAQVITTKLNCSGCGETYAHFEMWVGDASEALGVLIEMLVCRSCGGLLERVSRTVDSRARGRKSKRRRGR